LLLAAISCHYAAGLHHYAIDIISIFEPPATLLRRQTLRHFASQQIDTLTLRSAEHCLRH